MNPVIHYSDGTLVTFCGLSLRGTPCGTSPQQVSCPECLRGLLKKYGDPKQHAVSPTNAKETACGEPLMLSIVSGTDGDINCAACLRRLHQTGAESTLVLNGE